MSASTNNDNDDDGQLSLSEAFNVAIDADESDGDAETIVLLAWGDDPGDAASSAHRVICASLAKFDNEFISTDKACSAIRSGSVSAPGNLGEGACIWWSDSADWFELDETIDTWIGDATEFVIVDKMIALGDRIDRVQERLNRILQNGATVVLVNDDTRITPADRDIVSAIFSGLDRAGPALQRAAERRDIADWTEGRQWSGGRPPFGFEAVDGRLVPGNDFDRIRAILAEANDPHSDMSRRRAAFELGTSERTIGRILDDNSRRQKYGLRPTDWDAEEHYREQRNCNSR
ncbi:hypothetical protein [Natronosalvus amylolyticus]|uniref:hypothetical protein n=1 Tax=Natronosalvus amylolyticus TaxID=2961994 RepID=UPI0020C9BDA3|nr:hypothetical protein [Natronosalvus amylolyticus]